MIKLKDILNEDIRDWFGKGKTGGIGGGGWDRYGTSGQRLGKCGEGKPGDPYAACLSREKAQKLGRKGIAAFVKRKRAAQKRAGDAKKGGESKKGQRPVKVKTGASESITELNQGTTLYRGQQSPRSYTTQDGAIFFTPNRKYAEEYGDTIFKTSTPDNIFDIVNNRRHFNILKSWLKTKIGTIESRLKGNYMFYRDANRLVDTDNPRQLLSALANYSIAKWGLGNSVGRGEKEFMDENNIDAMYCIESGWDPTESISANLSVAFSKMPHIEDASDDLVDEQLFERNIPTDKKKWAYYKSQAKKKFDVYPSVYANAWAAKMYKKAGGGWRKGK